MLSFADWLEAWGMKEETEEPTIVEMLPLIDEGGAKRFVQATPEYTAPATAPAAIAPEPSERMCPACGLPWNECPYGAALEALMVRAEADIQRQCNAMLDRWKP
jgi:hypothetical protein